MPRFATLHAPTPLQALLQLPGLTIRLNILPRNLPIRPLQVAALLYYVASYFPGGASGAQFMLGFLGRSFGQACGACTRLVLGGSRG